MQPRATLRDPQETVIRTPGKVSQIVCSDSLLSNARSAFILQLYEGTVIFRDIPKEKCIFFLNKRKEMQLNIRHLKTIILLAFRDVRCEGAWIPTSTLSDSN